MSEPDRAAMRAADADREAVAERLRVAMDEGRLSLAEYDERLRRAYAATTFGELAPLTADLPEPVPPKKPAEVVRRERDKRNLIKEWRDWAGTAVILSGIWLVTSIASGELHFFWPLIPMGIWAVINVSYMIFPSKKDREGDD
ncbi:hypothetical protein GCM10011581_41720 [Saccharopolyspora subtropica]|uniref:DUF1707 domain-containing protein n=1 Tax=Saccharopolyspora thermophila TaxID=89367 RepID=A0A917K4A0_9PSEU|nr:DUF1707 domain-containing protein [Saccharopolyspora subtropica]GGJ00272.1 hypothetical protein GCM10011581_41720 [Saccharopolyspora subtropica]